MKTRIRTIGVFVLVAITLAAYAWTRPANKIERLGFPPVPKGAEIDHVYSLGGFSVVYMLRITLPISEIDSYAKSFTWERKRIGNQNGDIRIFTPEDFDTSMKSLRPEVGAEIRENYPETFSWWTIQEIFDGILFKKEGEGTIRRAYFDRTRGLVYIFYQYS